MTELDRAKIVHENFIHTVQQGVFPKARSTTSLQDASLSQEMFLDLFDSQLKSRQLDLISRHLKQQNLSFYTIGSSGHEGNAAFASVFNIADMAFLHYRSGAFMIQRAKSDPAINMERDILLSLLAARDDPIAAGRHKVFGSVPLNVPPQTSTIASHLPKAVGAALSITRAKELKITSKLAADSVVLCSFGDASVNHSVAQGAINSAQWISFGNYPLPLVFICEDNGLGISVPTPATWIESIIKERKGLHYIACDGLNLADVYRAAKEADTVARHNKKPVFIHVKTVRLLGHAGSDIESQYLSQKTIEETEFQDPLLHSARIILENNLLTQQEIIAQYKKLGKSILMQALKLASHPKLSSAEKVMEAIIPPTLNKNSPPKPDETKRKQVFGDLYPQLKLKRNLSQCINLALVDLLMQYENALVFGEDVAKKGGVYRVTAGLMERFGQRRVFDSLLDETTILGDAIGLAMNGFLPVPEIQFLAYYHNAEDQIRGEAATLPFFSSGQFTNPMVIRIASLAYQKGFGGHFHNDNSIAALRDIPGLIIACPSNGEDAVKMLRTCFDLADRQQRIVAFLEPIALYMTKDCHEQGDNIWLCDYPDLDERIELGEINIYSDCKGIGIISYGNGYYLSCQAECELREKHDIKVKVIDLRWLAPLNEEAILNATQDCNKIIIVDECRRTGSISEALMTMFMENRVPLPIIKRITGADSFIPLGTSWQYVLPSKDDIINTVKNLI